MVLQASTNDTLDVELFVWRSPQAELPFIDRLEKRRGVIESEEQRMRRQIDLASEPLDNPP